MQKKRIGAMILALAMMMSMVVTVPAAATGDNTTTGASFSDTAGHWGEGSISRWSGYGIVQGSDGKFNPDASMTRAELATVLANLLKLSEKGSNNFSDVQSGAWYEDAILKCAAAGIMKGDGVGANPNGTLTRAEAAVMLGRALGIAEANGSLSFGDASDIPTWATGYVKAMSDKGIVNGMGGNTFAPGAAINRASVTTILDRSISTYANEDGQTVTATDAGITLIAAKNVTVTGSVADLLVAAGAGNGTVTLKDATVTGIATVDAAKVALKVDGTSSVKTLALTEKASGATVAVSKSATITNLNTAANGVAVSGTGKVTNMTITAGENVTVAKETTVGTFDNQSGHVVKYGDKEIASGGGTVTPPSGGGGGGGGSTGGDSTDDGGSSGGSSTSKATVNTLEELKAAAAKTAKNNTITINTTATEIATQTSLVIDAKAKGTLTLSVAASELQNVTINAPDATKIVLEKNAEATNGTKLASLTINAPKAHVEVKVPVTGKVTALAVASNSLVISDTVGSVDMASAGGLSFATGGSATNVTISTSGDVTMSGTTTAPVSIAAPNANLTLTGSTGVISGNAAGATVNVKTATKVELDKNIGTVNVTTAEAEVNVAVGATVAEIKTTASATISGDGTIANVEAKAPVKVEAPQVQKVTVPADAGNNVSVEVAESVNLPVLDTAKNVEIKGAGSVESVDVQTGTTGNSVTVKVDATTTVNTVTNTGEGTVKDGAGKDMEAVKKAPAPTAADVEFLPPTAASGKGTIDLITTSTTTLEYSADVNAATWTALTADTEVDAGKMYYVRVKAVKAAEGVTATLASSPISGFIPVAVGIEAVTVSGTHLVGETLTASVNSSATGTPITYKWTVPADATSNETTTLSEKATLKLTDAHVGKTITVTATDSYEATKTATVTGVTADKSALVAAIADAKAAQVGVTNTQTEPVASEIPKGIYAAPGSAFTAILGVINAAEDVQELTTAQVIEETKKVTDGIAAFNKARVLGTMTDETNLKAKLTAAITAAEAVIKDTSIAISASNGADVEPAKFWVTSAANEAFGKVIEAAKKVTAGSTELSKAITDLAAATKTFEAAKKPGMTLDTTALLAAIADATANKTATFTATGDALPTEKWVTSEVMGVYEAAITTATAVEGPTQKTINEAIAALATATKTFNDAKQVGTKDIIAPKVTEVVVERTADATATVKFTSDEAGTYSYTVTKGETTSNPATGNVVVGANTINITGLTAGAYTLKLEVKDEATPANVTTVNRTIKGFTDVDAFKQSIKVPTGVEVSSVIMSELDKTTTYNVVLDGTTATMLDTENVPGTENTFAGTFTTTSFKSDANNYTAINLTDFLPENADTNTAKTVTIVQQNQGLSVYDEAKLEDNIDKDTWTKTKEYTLTTEKVDYELLIVDGETPITITMTNGEDITVVNITNNVKVEAKKIPAPDVITAPMVDQDNPEAIGLATSYTVKPEVAVDGVIPVTLTAKDVKIHKAGNDAYGYWVGIAVPFEEGATVNQNWGTTASAEGTFGDFDGTFVDGEKTYSSVYFNLANAATNSNTGWVQVKVGEITTQYKITFTDCTMSTDATVSKEAGLKAALADNNIKTITLDTAVDLAADLEIPANKTLTLPAGVNITTTEALTLTNNGTIVVNDEAAMKTAANANTAAGTVQLGNNISITAEAALAAEFMGTLDGNSKTVTLTSTVAKNNDVWFAAKAKNAAIKTLTINHAAVTTQVVPMIGVAGGETLLLDGVTIAKGTVTMSAGDNNESAYLVHSFATASTTFKNCINNLNYKATADKSYTSAFVGGYVVGTSTTAPTATKLIFENCTNNGNITIPRAGVFVGNGNKMSLTEITATGCVNNGAVTGTLSAALFAPISTSQLKANYNATLKDSITGTGSVSTMDATNLALALDTTLKITEIDNAMKYRLSYSAYAYHYSKTAEGEAEKEFLGTNLMNVVFDFTANETKGTIDTNHKVYSMVIKTNETANTWADLAYGCKYAIIDDKIVVDTAGFTGEGTLEFQNGGTTAITVTAVDDQGNPMGTATYTPAP